MMYQTISGRESINHSYNKYIWKTSALVGDRVRREQESPARTRYVEKNLPTQRGKMEHKLERSKPKNESRANTLNGLFYCQQFSIELIFSQFFIQPFNALFYCQ